MTALSARLKGQSIFDRQLGRIPDVSLEGGSGFGQSTTAARTRPKMFSKPCPHCGSADVFYRPKAGQWECRVCEQRFDSSAVDSAKPRGCVFLSYGHDPACTLLVRRVKADLERLGWTTWMDESGGIKTGDDWRREITKGIHRSQHVLAFLSRHSTRKPGVCRQEVAIALGPRKGHVYTVLVENPKEVTPPLIISHLQWLDMQRWHDLQQTDPAAANDLYATSFPKIVQVLERNEPFAGEIETLKRWLEPWDGTADLVAAEQGFTGRRWLLDGLVEPPWWRGDGFSDAEENSRVGEIERWRASLHGSRVFWISAGPGWGKSAVAARLAHAARSRVMAVHFCRHDQPQTRDARTVVRSIAFQMATQLGDYREALLRLANEGLVLQKLNSQELFTRLLSNPLTGEVGGGRDGEGRQLIVLDALDETLDNGESELVDLISSEFSKLPGWLGLLVTSRPEAPVERQLGAFGVHHQREDDPRNQQDLRSFARSWLDGLALPHRNGDSALDAVIKASDGMFLYLKKLQEAVSSGVVSLSEIHGTSTLPNGLGELYGKWFRKRFGSKEDYSFVYRPFFEILVSCFEPVPVSLLDDLMGWDEYTKNEAIETVGSLCNFSYEKAGFFHKSLKDWLIDPKRSGKFFSNARSGHSRIARKTESRLAEDPTMSSVWPTYLLKYGAVHAAEDQRPQLGAPFLVSQSASDASNRLGVGELRTAVNSFLNRLAKCSVTSLESVSSKDLAQLISRTEERSVLNTACDLLIGREGDWRGAFESCPLDSRGATWAFASRWAQATLKMKDESSISRFKIIRDIAIDPRHPLNLAAAYAFKYIGLNRPDWLTLEFLEPICRSWTYSKLVATSLLQQLTLGGSKLAVTISWADFWFPKWTYNRNELDLLAAAMSWRGLESPVAPKPKTLALMNFLDHKISKFKADGGCSPNHLEALDFFWVSGSDPDKCQNLLQSLDFSKRSSEVLDIYLKSPIFESMEIAAGILANRLDQNHGGLAGFASRADPDEDDAWGMFMAASKAAINSNSDQVFFQLLDRYANASDAWCRGLAANYFARWFRDASDVNRIKSIREKERMILKLLHDDDIWPVQEIFHCLNDFSSSLAARGVDWHYLFKVDRSPIVSKVPNWQDRLCDWASFEAAASIR